MKKLGPVLLICGIAAVLLAGCDGGTAPTTGTAGAYPQGRIVTADQGGIR